MRIIRFLCGLMILCVIVVGGCTHKTVTKEDSKSGGDVKTSKEIKTHEHVKTADELKADDEVNDEAKPHDDIKTNDTSELSDEVRQLFKDYDGFVEEHCRYMMKCQSNSGIVGDKAFDLCMTIEARNDKRNAEDPIPECPNYYMISRALTIKCENEMFKMYGMKACTDYLFAHSDFYEQYQKALKACVFSHEFLKPHYGCYCANLEKIHKDRDEILIAKVRNLCKEQGF